MYLHVEVIRVEQVGIRALKGQLSKYVARVKRGDVIMVTDHGTPVARLVPVRSGPEVELRALAQQMGVQWHGGKPRGLPAEEASPLSEARSLSRAILEDR